MSSIEMVPTLRKGLPSKTLEAVSKQLGLTPMATGALLGIPARTLSRRLASRRKLTPEESQRVYRLSRVVILATRALGNIEKARHWLQTSNRVLGDEVPLHLLDTDVGTEAVIEELGRIEYGVFA
jgi:putative toxin-antitoxin system antitoxin component (TIGR02293 family)